jgi:transcription elongation factor GreA
MWGVTWESGEIEQMHEIPKTEKFLTVSALEDAPENAEIVEAAETDEVRPGVIVSICYEGDDEPERYLIGSIEERSDDVETLTVGSPLGQALLGAKVDDIVGFEAPGGTLNVRIVKIEV